MKSKEIDLLRKLAERTRATPLAGNEARIARDLAKQGYIQDIRTNLHILSITPAGLAALESLDQVKASVKPIDVNLGPISARLTNPKPSSNIRYRKRAIGIPEGLKYIPRYRAAQDKKEDS